MRSGLSSHVNQKQDLLPRTETQPQGTGPERDAIYQPAGRERPKQLRLETQAAGGEPHPLLPRTAPLGTKSGDSREKQQVDGDARGSCAWKPRPLEANPNAVARPAAPADCPESGDSRQRQQTGWGPVRRRRTSTGDGSTAPPKGRGKFIF